MSQQDLYFKKPIKFMKFFDPKIANLKEALIEVMLGHPVVYQFTLMSKTKGVLQLTRD